MAQRGRFLAPDIGKHLLREEDEVIVDEVTHHWVAYLPASAYGLVGLVLVLWLPVVDADLGGLVLLLALGLLSVGGFPTATSTGSDIAGMAKAAGVPKEAIADVESVRDRMRAALD